MSAKKKPIGTPTSNTLFNYFKKSDSPQCGFKSPQTPTPSSNSKNSSDSSKKSTPKERENESPNRKRKTENSDEPPKKNSRSNGKNTKSKRQKSPVRRRLVKPDNVQSSEEEPEEEMSLEEDLLGDDGTEDEYQPSSAEEVESSDEEEVESETHSSGSEPEVTPEKGLKKRGAKSQISSKPKRARLTLSPPKKKATPTILAPPAPTPAIERDEDDKWPHLSYTFLKEEKIKDASGKLKSHPDYNPRTLWVPEDFKKSLSPFMLQWWQFKENYFDCVLFMKTGKFYELYHMDAVVGYKVLNCSYMGTQGDTNRVAHSGFPEVSYAKYAKKLVEEGYKVARIEQLETADEMNARLQKNKGSKVGNKAAKTMIREVCKVTCEGTETFSAADVYENVGESCKPIETGFEDNKFLLAIKRKDNVYGVTFVDTTIGEFHVGCFEDDKRYSRLNTLMAHFPPCRILLLRNQWGKADLNNLFPKVNLEFLLEDKEFLSETKTMEQIKEFGARNFFENASFDVHKLAICSFGAIFWYLKRCLIHHQLMTLSKFKQYVPVDLIYNQDNIKTQVAKKCTVPKYMVLDSTALAALHVLKNSSNTQEGTLIEQLNHCVTSFGKRMLRAQLVKPLTDIEKIKQRQVAISVLLKYSEVISKIRNGLTQIQDLERMLPRIHAMTSKAYAQNHPNLKANYSDELQLAYSKKNIEEFTNALSSFERSQNLVESLQDSGCLEESELLYSLCSLNTTDSEHGSQNDKHFPNLKEHLSFFKNAFDHKKALKEGRIIPQSRGVDQQYDAVEDEIKDIERDMQKHLDNCGKSLGCKVTFSGGKPKNKYLLEIPIGKRNQVKHPLTMVGQKNKSTCWASTEESQRLGNAMTDAEERKKSILRDISNKVFLKFGEHIEEWSRAVYCLSMLDFLTAIAQYCLKEENGVCVPNFVDPNESQPFISAEEGRFPCSTGDQVYVPNDTTVGKVKENEKCQASVLFLTGPNMGGKSTVMRQIGLMTILAQMGCHVPAKKFTLTPVDRIFTRIGSNDNIIAGQSTFFNELLEVGCTMHHATKNSLALIDELGRGTSTYDGTVIAAAVLQKLINIGCLTVFSTHYHSLAKDFGSNSAITFQYMDYIFESSTNSTDTEALVFLYKLTPGVCSRSFGFNAARLADLPSIITQNGSKISTHMEERYKMQCNFTQLINNDVHIVKNCLESLSII